MLELDIEYFNRFLAESFPDGVSVRELRLSSAEVDYLQENYSFASLYKMDGADDPDGKCWYEVRLVWQHPSKF
jgi:hypothetical protein